MYIYWEMRENDWVFVDDNTRRESSAIVHWQALKLGFLVGEKQESWEVIMRSQNHKSCTSNPSDPRVVRWLQGKQGPQWRASGEPMFPQSKKVKEMLRTKVENIGDFSVDLPWIPEGTKEASGMLGTIKKES